MAKLPYSRFHPFLPSQGNGTDAGGVRCRCSNNHFLICALLLIGWFHLAAYTEHTVLGTTSGSDISLGQMTLLTANNILGPGVDLKVISLLPSSHSFRIYWHNLFIKCILTEDHHLPRILQGAGGILIMMTAGHSRSLALEGSQHSLAGCITSKWAKKWLSKSVKPLPACSVSKDFPKWHKNWVESSDVKLGTTFPRFLLGRVWLDPASKRHLCELWSSVPGLWILTNSMM